MKFLKSAKKYAAISSLAALGLFLEPATNANGYERSPSGDIFSLIPTVISEYETTSISQIVADEIAKLKNKPPYINEQTIEKLIYAESWNNPLAVSNKGARGLMQLQRRTWDEFEMPLEGLDYSTHVFHPRENIRVGLEYLSWLDDFCKSHNPQWKHLSNKKRLETVLAAYNWGIGNLSENGWDISQVPRETKKYISDISD